MLKKFIAKYFKSNTLKLYKADSVEFKSKDRQFIIRFEDIPFKRTAWIKKAIIFNTENIPFYVRKFDYPVFFDVCDTLTLTIIISWDKICKKIKGKYKWVGVIKWK